MNKEQYMRWVLELVNQENVNMEVLIKEDYVRRFEEYDCNGKIKWYKNKQPSAKKD